MHTQLNRRDGPYAPAVHSAGGVPSIIPDLPVSIALLVCFLALGGLHMRRFITNKKRGHLFAPNAMVFGLCNVRVITFSLRAAWACYPENIPIGLASTLFVYAGIILLFLAQLLFTQRIIRSQHPRLGWSRPFSFFINTLYALILVTLVMVITVVVQSFFTLDDYTHYIDRSIQFYALSFYLFIAFAPLPILLLSSTISILQRRSPLGPKDPFGQGSLTAQILIVTISTLLLTLGATYRAASTFAIPVALTDDRDIPTETPWYFSDAAFYTLDFATEYLVIVLWYIARIDLRFHIPDGACGSYNVSTDEDTASMVEDRSLVGTTALASPSNEKTSARHTPPGSGSTSRASVRGPLARLGASGRTSPTFEMLPRDTNIPIRQEEGRGSQRGDTTPVDQSEDEQRQTHEARWSGRAYREGNVICINAIADEETGGFAMRDAQSVSSSTVSWDDLPGLPGHDY